MPAQPVGAPAPLDGSLPAQAAAGLNNRSLSLYVHVPFCAVRCGYCDFNTYTATELGPGADRDDFRQTTALELDLAARVRAQLGDDRTISTIFFGGGTPTLLPASALTGVLADIRERFTLAADCEITTEANPDTLSRDYLQQLARAGFTRVSVGMQSAVPHVLHTLDRTHDPSRIPAVAEAVKDSGLQLSLDLIYGTPGESVSDWQVSVETALACNPDHLSAYSLIVEDGTRMGARVARGELPAPNDDDLAEKYELLDALITPQGYQWYEVSNFASSADARRPLRQRGSADTRCAHNLAYWRSDDWWGVGAGAHSHFGGVRWWNVKHPRAWAGRLQLNQAPGYGREILSAQTQELERVMLLTRVRGGLHEVRTLLGYDRTAHVVNWARSAGWLTADDELTITGRLMADALVLKLLEA